MTNLEKFLAIIIIILFVIVIGFFINRNNASICEGERCSKRKKIKSTPYRSTCHGSSNDKVRMKLSATRKLATFSINLGRTDVKHAYIVEGEGMLEFEGISKTQLIQNNLLADITGDFVKDSGIANGFWRLSEEHATLLEKGFVNVRVVFSNDDVVTMKVV